MKNITNNHPNKWRETVDPFTINFNNFILIEVLGYPHAGNDVFHVRGISSNKEILGYLKVEKQKTANIKRELETLNNIDSALLPKIIDYSLNAPRYIITEEIEGERLSQIFKNDPNLNFTNYLKKYGELLAMIHNINFNAQPVVVRDFNLSLDFYIQNNLKHVKQYLFKTKLNESFCFIHGDAHYANILWKEGFVTALLDFELAGYGSREYDLAWALTLRPSQIFLNSKKDRDIVLDSYRKYHNFSLESFNYYYVLISMFFYNIAIKQDDLDYQKQCLELVNEIVMHK